MVERGAVLSAHKTHEGEKRRRAMEDPNALPVGTEALTDRLQRRLFTVVEAAQILSISRSKAYELLARGHLPSVRIGRSRRISARAINDYIERLESEVAP
jgi:excisionase family DNA binding protein